MSINQLGYVVVESTDLDKWRRFGTVVLGLAESTAPEGSLYLKADTRHFRILVIQGARDGLYASGWETRHEADFFNTRQALEAAGVEIIESSPQDRALRKVTGMFSFSDPSGNRHEVFWGPISDFLPFVSPAGVSGFVTGNMGMGHVVLPALNFDETFAFWRDVCGFGLSDVLHFPTSPDTQGRVYFMHCNPRQHSLALAEMPQPSGCVHVMLEVRSLGDVGRALDRANAHGAPIAATLGQHINDDMVSFYLWTPGGFALEYGCGGMIVDWERNHTVFETTRGSHWGHQWQMPPSPQTSEAPQ